MRDNVNSIRHTTHDAKSIGDATRANAMAIDTLARDAKLAGEDAASKAYLPWTEAGGPDECAHGYADGIPCPECDKAKVAPGGDCPECDAWRALLARDVADVAFHVVDFQEEVEDLDTQVHSSEWAIERYGDSAIGAAREHRKMAELIETRESWVAKIEDCQAWLTRARAALR